MPNVTGASAWAVEYIDEAIAQNLVPRNLQGLYTTPTTRAEFAALAVAAYESVKGEITGRSYFDDTEDVNAQKAAFVGITSGTGNNNFSPDAQLTREQAATMLSVLAGLLDKPFPQQNPTFDDTATIQAYINANATSGGESEGNHLRSMIAGMGSCDLSLSARGSSLVCTWTLDSGFTNFNDADWEMLIVQFRDEYLPRYGEQFNRFIPQLCQWGIANPSVIVELVHPNGTVGYTTEFR